MVATWRHVVAMAAAVMAAGHSTTHAEQARGTGGEEPRFRMSVSAGAANLFRIDDQSFGKTGSLGAGFVVRLRRQLWLDLEVNRFAGLAASPAPCGLVNVACTGGGREGYDAATLGSLALTYRFAPGGLHVFLRGGYGFVRAQGFATTTFGSGERIEQAVSDRGWGPAAGCGVHIPLGSGWALEPGIQIYGADGPNLIVLRGAIGLQRGW